MEPDWCALHVCQDLKTPEWLAGVWDAVPALMDWRLCLRRGGRWHVQRQHAARLTLSEQSIYGWHIPGQHLLGTCNRMCLQKLCSIACERHQVEMPGDWEPVKFIN